MSKRCEDCEHFNGYNYDDGTPCCDYKNSSGDTGYEVCPFNDVTSLRKKGIKIEIDAGFMDDYIKHTIKNSVESEAYKIATSEVKSIINSEVKENIRKKVVEKLDEKLDRVIDDALDDFLNGEIHSGGLYGGSLISRKQYIANIIEDKLKNIDRYSIKETAESAARNQINDFTRRLKDEINSSIKTYFDDVTRSTLTDNIVSMLMCNDTYKKLADSMGRLLPDTQTTNKR